MEEIVGTIVIEGVKYLLKKVADEAGKIIWRAFTDEDEDGVPDNPENPFQEWDEEPDEWTPLPSYDTSEPVLPPAETSTPATIGDIVLMTPDGPVVLYTESGGEEYDALVSRANEQWLEKNGAAVKPFEHYSVSEALLFLIAVCSLFGFFCKIFKRRKL